MAKLPSWDPYLGWRHTDIRWEKINISKEDLKRFTRRSDGKGLLQTFSFLLFIAVTVFFSYYAFSTRNWIHLVLGL